MIYYLGVLMKKTFQKKLRKDQIAKPIEYVSFSKKIESFEADGRKDEAPLILKEILTASKRRKCISQELKKGVPHAA